MTRQSAAAKAGEYLVEGRLIVTLVDPGRRVVLARCRGDGHVWTLGFDGAEWSCSCPARSDCSHLLALRRVVAVDLEAR